MPNNNKTLRLKALAREQQFIDPLIREKDDEEKIKKYVESFTAKLIQQQKKIHLLLTDLFIQEIKLISLLRDPKYKVVVTVPFISGSKPVDRYGFETNNAVGNTKIKFEQNEINSFLKYLRK